MWSLLLFLRLLSSLPVLVLSNREQLQDSRVVVTYMSRENIPLENWWDYRKWTIAGSCEENGGTPFTKVYLWEDARRWILEGSWEKITFFDELNSVWKEKSIFDQLEACKEIIEFNIDGGSFNQFRMKEEEELMQNYADKLVDKLKETKKTHVTITWYNNYMYGMDWLVGPNRDKLKFTWKKGMEKVETEKVKQLTWVEFWKRLILETCETSEKIGECFGILVAYADCTLILCNTVMEKNDPLLTECYKSYNKYTEKSGPIDDRISKVDEIEPLVEYLKELKNRRGKSEL